MQLLPPFCSLTEFYCANIHRQFSVFGFIARFILKIVQKTEKHVHFLTRKLFLVERDLFPRDKTMNNKTKKTGQ